MSGVSKKLKLTFLEHGPKLFATHPGAYIARLAEDGLHLRRHLESAIVMICCLVIMMLVSTEAGSSQNEHCYLGSYFTFVHNQRRPTANTLTKVKYLQVSLISVNYVNVYIGPVKQDSGGEELHRLRVCVLTVTL